MFEFSNVFSFVYDTYTRFKEFAYAIFTFLNSSFNDILQGNFGITFPQWVINFLTNLFPRLLEMRFIDLLFGSGVIILLVVAVITFIKNVFL